MNSHRRSGGAVPDDYRLFTQHVRRRPQGSVRPQDAGRSGQLRRRKEMQTRSPGPAAQPFQMVCGQNCPRENGEQLPE